MRCSDFLRPSRRTSLPSLGDTMRCACRFAPSGPRRTTAGQGFIFRSPLPDLTHGDDQDLPSSWRTLACLRPALRPRRDQRYHDKAIAVGRHGPTHIVPRGLSTRGNFGAPSHGISTRCLRFAPWVAPKDARLASGCGPSSTRRDWLPAGFLRKVSELLQYISFPFPKVLGANDVPLSAGSPSQEETPRASRLTTVAEKLYRNSSYRS